MPNPRKEAAEKILRGGSIEKEYQTAKKTGKYQTWREKWEALTLKGVGVRFPGIPKKDTLRFAKLTPKEQRYIDKNVKGVHPFSKKGKRLYPHWPKNHYGDHRDEFAKPAAGAYKSRVHKRLAQKGLVRAIAAKNIREARLRPLKDVATKDMTAEERREWSKRQK